MITVDGVSKEKTVGYDPFLPDFSMSSTWMAFGLIAVGIVAVWMLEKFGAAEAEKED